jgi:DNA-directed RNA polymerase specialized sigma subunit
MSLIPSRIPDWWDREVDHRGRVLRLDVRIAAKKTWEAACALALKELIDIHDATDIMEKTVAQISNFLNERESIPPEGDNIPALLMKNFRLELLKHKERWLERSQQIENPEEIAEYRQHAIWEPVIHSQLDFNVFFEPLTDREKVILLTREQGKYDWDTVGKACGISGSRARHIHAEAVRKMKARYERSNSHRKPPKS